MATAAVVYGIDVQAITDLPDPEVLCSENACAAYQCARRLTTPSGAMQDIGEVVQYDSIDVRDWLGARFNLTDPSVQTDLQTQATQVLLEDPFVVAAQVLVAFSAGVLSLTVQVQGANGPFGFVLQVSALTTQILLPGQV
jgi:hypothetical protein